MRFPSIPRREGTGGRSPVPAFSWSLTRHAGRRLASASLAALLIVPALPSAAAAADYVPTADPYSMYATTLTMGAQAWWRAGWTGKGIDVAVIDSGVARVEGLSGAGKVIDGPDLSLESQADNLRSRDTNGHGTFMAGLIAGRDSSVTGAYDVAAKTAYLGVAPDARILSIKVATADGGADVTQVIAAINWVIQHKNDNGMNIRVLSLSYGTNSRQAYSVDPLAYAVERAWKAGIVVVAATGNAGFHLGLDLLGILGSRGLSDPAYDPLIMAICATDTKGTAAISDDAVAAFSTSADGILARKPDVCAPGAHIQGLRVPGGFVDGKFSAGRVGDRFFRGSGTSQATALAAGAVALVLQKFPTATPDMVKAFFTANASRLTRGTILTEAQGKGTLNLATMLSKTPAKATQSVKLSTGRGTIDAARGTDRVARDGVLLKGEKDIFGKAVSTTALATASAAGSSWSGGTWNGSSWSGSSWSGSSWSGSSWSGSSWSGSSWSSSSWSGSSWSGSSWSGSSWSGSSWSGSSWSGASWSTDGWK